MGWVLTQVALQRVLERGIRELRVDLSSFNEIFDFYLSPQMQRAYGQVYVDKIRAWFESTKIPVVQAWAFNPTRIPCISLHLAQEQEDESKAAVGDFLENDDEQQQDIGTAVFSVMVDLGIHCSKQGDQVLWLYYIVSYILFKQKMYAEGLGLKLHTFSASDYNKDMRYAADQIWNRWIRFRCVTENFWKAAPYDGPFDLDSDIDFEPKEGSEESRVNFKDL